MEPVKQVRRSLDRLYAELAELKRHIIIHSPPEKTQHYEDWDDLLKASEKISSLWTGPGAVDEIRAQREK